LASLSFHVPILALSAKLTDTPTKHIARVNITVLSFIFSPVQLKDAFFNRPKLYTPRKSSAQLFVSPRQGETGLACMHVNSGSADRGHRTIREQKTISQEASRSLFSLLRE
jgi:hypothetical protein